MNYGDFKKFYERNIPDIKSLNYLNRIINNYDKNYFIISCIKKPTKRNAYEYLKSGKISFNEGNVSRKDYIYNVALNTIFIIISNKCFKIFNNEYYSLLRYTNSNNYNDTWYPDLVYKELMNLDVAGTQTSCRVSSLRANDVSNYGTCISIFSYNGVLNVGNSNKEIIIEN